MCYGNSAAQSGFVDRQCGDPPALPGGETGVAALREWERSREHALAVLRGDEEEAWASAALAAAAAELASETQESAERAYAGALRTQSTYEHLSRAGTDDSESDYGMLPAVPAMPPPLGGCHTGSLDLSTARRSIELRHSLSSVMDSVGPSDLDACVPSASMTARAYLANHMIAPCVHANEKPSVPGNMLS